MENIMNFEGLIEKELIRIGWKPDDSGNLIKDNKMLCIHTEQFYCYKITKDGGVKHLIDYSIFSDDKMLKFFLEI